KTAFQWCACPDTTVPPVGPVLTALRHPQSALFNFKSFLIVILLFICASTYLRQQRPSMFVEKKPGLFGLVYKASVIGTRLSPYVSLSCILMGVWNLFF
ncbi:conserved small protein, partial [Chrysochromulina tobinii]